MRDGGLLRFYSLRNVAEPPRMPVEKLVLSGQAFFDEQRVGVTRLYAAMGANSQIDKLVRVYNIAIPTDCLFVVISGEQYRIEAQQKEGDNVLLTLVRLEDFYDVAE